MKVLTESEIRARLKKEDIKELLVDPKVIVTPSAREYLNEKDIKLVYTNEVEKTEQTSENKEEKKETKKIVPKYILKDSGAYFDTKPENMTQLYGNELVLKNHSNIIFRGKLDSLQSKILEIQVMANKNNEKKLVEELQEVLNFARDILKAEVLNEEFEDIALFGLSEKEIRAISHNPKKHLGVEHVLPNYEMGEIVVGLNSIRSQVREVELNAIPIERNDLIKALNRLSSAIYVMMCRYLAGYYN
ncbi:MAG: cobalamin adenosyltransferase [Clostridiales bacterium]|nr:cobalamin adenosyltransferase [Clostridiales bacterium]